MSKNNPAKKVKKYSDERLTVNDAICNEFFLGDIAFTFLPIGIIAILRYAFGTLDSSIFFLSEWAFMAIMLSSLALTRILELKVMHQKDTSWRAVALSRICIILIILSTICLACYTVKEQGSKINDQALICFQFILLALSTIFLWIGHYHRERLNFGRRKFPENIPESEFYWYISFNLKDARGYIRATCTAFNKKYEFRVSNEAVDDTVEYEKKDIDRIIKDMQNDLSILQQRRNDWEKMSCADVANPENIDGLGR